MQTKLSSRELWYALFAILLITGAYLLVVYWFGQIPRASEFFGHTIGILGFLLMLMTETLYSYRKRSRSARWGRMSAWLDFHIFTGIVGPFMVLLHTSWKFNGLAGIVTLLTAIVVLSGFIGRYIYTAVPRTVDGVEIEADFLEQQIAMLDANLKDWLATQGDETTRALAQRLFTTEKHPGSQMSALFGRSFTDWGYRLQWWYEKNRLDRAARTKVDELERLVIRRQQLSRQIASLAMARRMLALWHAVHIPIGMALFTAAFIHVGAAIYYATLLH